MAKFEEAKNAPKWPLRLPVRPRKRVAEATLYLSYENPINGGGGWPQPYRAVHAFRLHRVVHLELDRVWCEFEFDNFFHLQVDVGFDLILGEYATFEQEVMVRLERVQCFTQ